jgi:nicotinamidase-related amidase
MKALILVDFENEWIDKSSEFYLGDISETIDKTNQLIDFCRDNDYKIIFISHIEKGSKDSFEENSKNVEIIPQLNKEDSDILVKKYKISPFYQTTLKTELLGINEIVVAGILTNLCVRSLVQDAYDRDFAITVVKDCCKAFDQETQDFTFKDLKETREEIEFVDFNEFMENILK